jgi:hypothetical protein
MSAVPQNPRRPVRSQHRARGSAARRGAAQDGATQPGPARKGPAPDDASAGILGVLPYALVLAGVAAGLVLAGNGSRYTGRGIAVAGCALLVAGLVRLALPPRYAGLLATRGKAFDVLAFVVLGGGVLAIALILP